MRQSVHELNRIPTEFHENGAPELLELPDEFNRFPRPQKKAERRFDPRKLLLLLTAAGILTLGVFMPMRSANRTAEADAGVPAATAGANPTGPAAAAETPAASPEPTMQPEAGPYPDVRIVYFQTHSVSNGVVLLTDPAHTSAVHVRLYAEPVDVSVFEYDFTEEDIARGRHEFMGIDLNEFYSVYLETYEALGTYEQPYLEATLSFRLDNGEEGTVTQNMYPQPEEWVSVSYHGDDEEATEWHYPGCFVAIVYDTPNDSLLFTADPDKALEPGEIFVSVTVDGERIPPELCSVHRLSNSYEWEGETYTTYEYLFVMQRPESFPPEGTAQILTRERFVHFDYVWEKTTTIGYSIYD